VARASILLDQRLGLRECTSTAVSLERDASFREGSPDWCTALHEQAAGRLRHVDRSLLRSAFRMPALTRPALVIAAITLAFLLVPLVPPVITVASPALDRQEAARTAAETTRVREATRRLAARAEDLARVAEMSKLFAARQAARKVALEARRLSEAPPRRAEAMARLTSLAEDLRRSERDALGRTGEGRPFGLDGGLDGASRLDEDTARLAELSRLLDELGVSDLQADLDAFRAAMQAEAELARAEGRVPRVDIEDLEKLLDRVRRARRALEDLQGELASNPRLAELFSKLNAQQLELLRQIERELEKFAGL
jgi:hypothetical protein